MLSSNKSISEFPKNIPSELDRELLGGNFDRYDKFVQIQLQDEFETLITRFSQFDQKHKEAFVSRFMAPTKNQHSILSELLEDLWGELKESKANTMKECNVSENNVADSDILTPGQVASCFPKVGTINTIKKRVKTNKLIGYSDSGKMCIPAWQFSNGNILPNLDKLLSHINVEGLEVVSAMETPMQDYDNKPAYQFLQEGDLDTAIEIVELITEITRD